MKFARKASSKEDPDADPFLNFGFGVYGYFNYIVIMIFVFAVLSLITLPQLMYFKASDGIVDGTWAEFSIGSLTFSQA